MSILTELFTEIANAIRTKKGTTDLINVEDFANEILNITTNDGVFSSLITPTAWTSPDESTANATNDYGTWHLTLTGYDVVSGGPFSVFNGDYSTKATIKIDGTPVIVLDCPVQILPKAMIISVRNIAKTLLIEGYRAETNEWETISTPMSAITPTANTIYTYYIENKLENYYSKFRLTLPAISSQSEPYEFQIISGMYK